MTDFRTYLIQRAPLIGAAALLGAVSSLWMQPAPSDDVEGLQQSLSEQSGALVSGVAWEPSRGVLGDLCLGRPLLFQGAPLVEGTELDDAAQRRDIYRAFIRVSPTGRVLDVRSIRNLTGTRKADEYGLGSRGNLAWFGSRGEDSAGSITFLDLAGEQNESNSLLNRLQLGLSRLVETGSWNGLGRSDFFWEGHDLSVSVNRQITVRAGTHSKEFTHAQLFSSSGPEEELPYRFVSRQREPSAWLHWAANTGRHVVGSGVVAWAEGRAFTLWDNLHQVGYSVTSQEVREPLPLPPPKKKEAHPEPEWPPANIQVPGREGTPEGTWRPAQSQFLPKTPEPLFYRTVIHPDPQRPYAELHLVAMDMRRLELGMGAGYEDPHPDTGPPGSGQLPTEGDLPHRVVATFNGAFKAVHGQYGMKAEDRVLVEPVIGAATVAVDESGQVAFGTWTKKSDVRAFSSFRQNLDPLVAGGKINPHQREVWGDHLYGSGVAVQRSALCLHSSGHVLYGWATEATGESLARGMAAAGCDYALHLDMNPGHCAFLFNSVESVKPLKAQGEPLDRRMKVNPTRFIRWSPKDFFYVATRGAVPQDQGVKWTPAPGQLPAPSTIPGIFFGTKTVGGLAIEFDRVPRGRLSFDLAPGRAESGDWEQESHRPAPLISWGLGHRTRGTRTGLTMGTSVLSPLHRNYANLVLKEGELSLLPPAEPQAEDAQTQIVQLPALARDGELTERARQLGGKRKRGALCIDRHGDLLIARMTHDTPAPLAQSLLELGCHLVAEMDRGSHPPPLVARAGTEHPPEAVDDQTRLQANPKAMRPRTRLF